MIRNLAAAVLVALSQVRGGAPAPHDPSPSPKGIETGDLDRRVDPCTDFDAFANGAWRKANPIPETMPRWSRRVAAHEANAHRVQELLDEVSRRTDWPEGSVRRLVGDHYASCMDEAAIEAAGVTPLAPLLAGIRGVRDRAGLQAVIRSLHGLAVTVPFGLSGALDYQDPSRYVANVVAGGLGMPDRDWYLKPEPRLADAREKYRAHVARVLALGGMPEGQAGRAAGAVFDLEKRLAEASLESAKAADPAATDHRTTFAGLERLAPHVDWKRYFDAAGLPRVDLNVSEPAFLRRMDRELAETPIATWKAYFEWHLLESASPWLSTPFAREWSEFHGKVLGDAAALQPRPARCALSAEELFGEAVGRIYAERWFPPAAKEKAREIADNLLAALKDEVARVEWMSPATKKTALEKLAALDVETGYPDRWTDYSAVAVRRDAFFPNVAAGRGFNVARDRSRIGRPTGRGLWALPPSSAGAYIDFQLNEVVLPAGFLQPPYFDAEATDAVNYGALGIGLAHDLTHFIDPFLGSDNDAAGRPRKWWAETDRKGFDERSRCLADQFDGYFVAPGVHLSGKRVLGEAIGDLAGVRIAWRALEKSMESRPVPVVAGFTPEQQFFISWAQATGAAMRPEAERELVASDPHPVPKFRVIGPLSNSPEFQKAFSCPMSSAMVRPPEMRCMVW